MKNFFETVQFRQYVAFIHDLIWVPVALFMAFIIRLNYESLSIENIVYMKKFLIIALPVQTLTFYFFGLYRGMWRFASIPDLIRILQSVWLGTVITYILVFFTFRLDGMPRSVMLLHPVFLMLGLATPRLIYRWYKDRRTWVKLKSGRRALILGAGKAGDLLVRDLIQNDNYIPVGILDDAKDKIGRELHGIRILGYLNELEKIILEFEVDVVLIAMPSANARTMRCIFDTCNSAGIECVTLPSIVELADGHVGVSRLRQIRLEDLLGRDVIKLDDAAIHTLLDGKRVLITGAGGSIGSELARQAVGYSPMHIVLIENSEFNLYTIDAELKERTTQVNLTSLLGDVRDLLRMKEIFEKYRPQIVLHAAAYKHVPMVENNSCEGIKTNIFGTKTIADISMECGVEKFVLVSTDKAVNPTNVMGATKRIAEMYCQNLSGISSTLFITTRFGNVLGSTGSVVPLFKKQIERGGPVTVTHPEITRYFMTIPEAVSLILQATSMGHGGEIYVLDMGQPVKILDLAREMIRLSGYVPEQDMDIVFTGLRPGEKLHEELFHEKEQLVGTGHKKILRAIFRGVSNQVLNNSLQDIACAVERNDDRAILQLLHQIVPEFQVNIPQLEQLGAVIPLHDYR